jgi:predicted AAA+ superfamily ATPase
MISRTLKLPKANSFFLFGPRQTGKSSLIRAFFEPSEMLYVNLLLSREFQRLKLDPGLLAEDVRARSAGIKYVIIDEVQKIPELLDEVHNILESSNPPIFGLTGSSARKLRRAEANLLAGRAWTLGLFALTAEELGEQFSISRALSLGTLPKVYLEETLDASANTLRAYVDTYLKEEIEAEAVTRNLATFLKFLPLAAENSGQELNFSKIARVCLSNYNTIKAYFKILEDTLIGRYLYPLSTSTRQQLSKRPKFYFFDTGVLRAILGRERSDVHVGTYEYGNLFESWVINEVWRLNSYYQKNLKTFFFRTESGQEVDLVLVSPNGETIGVEIKSSLDVAPAEIARGMNALGEFATLSRRICVTQGLRPKHIHGVDHLPWTDFFSWLKSW